MKRRLKNTHHHKEGGGVDTNSVDSKFSIRSWSPGFNKAITTSHNMTEQAPLTISSPSSPVNNKKSRGRRRSVSLPRLKSPVFQKKDAPVTATLSAVSDIEKLAQRSGAYSEDERFKVYPDFAYPNTRMNKEELRVEMNIPSAYYHNLRQPSKTDDEIGLFYLEVLQCFGLPRFEYFKEPSAFVVAVCGSQAFKTDVMPPLVNPIWLSKMRRACTFPVYYAYQTCHLGVFASASAEDGFNGRVGLKLSQFRPGSTYDITLPLRLSTQVYARQQRGSIRVRFHLHYHSESAAVWSYIPKRLIPKFQPNESVVVNCADVKSFQNVARTVHGQDMQSKFSMSLAKAISREVQYQQIHILRYLPKREIHYLRTWKYPIISAFVFFSWMHAVYFGSIRYLPGNILTYLLLHMWKNYGIYCLDGKYDNGFLAPTADELLRAMVRRGGKGGDSSEKNKKKEIKKKKKSSKKEKWVEGKDFPKSPSARKPCIEPITMERMDPDFCKTALQDLDNEDEASRPATISEIAKDFRHRLPTDSRIHWLQVYPNTFNGADAVSWLIQEGYALDRNEGVQVGQKMAKQFKLFQHLTKKHDFADDPNLIYRFLTLDDSDYVIKTHKPFAKGLFRALNFRADPTLAREHAHIEFPFASAEDHPRYKVKDSLILRSRESKALFEKMQAEKEGKEAVNAFGVERQHGRGKVLDDERSVTTNGQHNNKKERKQKNKLLKLARVTHNNEKKKKKKEFSDDDSLTDTTSPTRSDASGQAYVFKPNTLDPTVMIERRNSDDSMESLDEKEKGKENDPNYEVKIFPKPSNQDMLTKSKGGDKTMAEVLVRTRHKMHQYCGHVFNDRAFKLDMPKVGLGRNSGDWNSNQKHNEGRFKSGPMTLDDADDKATAEEEQLYLSARKDEYDRLLHLGRYVHTNPFVAKIAEFVQPMLEMMQIGIFMNRSLFNILTWRDPILSLWVVVIGTIMVITLHCFPWRVVFGLGGVYFLGPHNWAIRIAKEYAGTYKEPDFDKVIKKKKPKKDPVIVPDEPLFSNLAPDNRIIQVDSLDGSNIRPVAVPVTPLMYNRFYDWPPEPEYARVKAEILPQNDPVFEKRLKSIDFDAGDYQADITGSALVKPLTRWMRARKAVKGVKKGVSKSVKAVANEAGSGVKALNQTLKSNKKDADRKVSFE